jgi:hypothetical protein
MRPSAVLHSLAPIPKKPPNTVVTSLDGKINKMNIPNKIAPKTVAAIQNL